MRRLRRPGFSSNGTYSGWPASKDVARAAKPLRYEPTRRSRNAWTARITESPPVTPRTYRVQMNNRAPLFSRNSGRNPFRKAVLVSQRASWILLYRVLHGAPHSAVARDQGMEDPGAVRAILDSWRRASHALQRSPDRGDHPRSRQRGLQLRGGRRHPRPTQEGAG